MKTIAPFILSLALSGPAFASTIDCELVETNSHPEKVSIQLDVSDTGADGKENVLSTENYDASVFTAFGNVQTLMLIDRRTGEGTQATFDKGDEMAFVTVSAYSGSVPKILARLDCAKL